MILKLARRCGGNDGNGAANYFGSIGVQFFLPASVLFNFRDVPSGLRHPARQALAPSLGSQAACRNRDRLGESGPYPLSQNKELLRMTDTDLRALAMAVVIGAVIFSVALIGHYTH